MSSVSTLYRNTLDQRTQFLKILAEHLIGCQNGHFTGAGSKDCGLGEDSEDKRDGKSMGMKERTSKFTIRWTCYL